MKNMQNIGFIVSVTKSIFTLQMSQMTEQEVNADPVDVYLDVKVHIPSKNTFIPSRKKTPCVNTSLKVINDSVPKSTVSTTGINKAHEATAATVLLRLCLIVCVCVFAPCQTHTCILTRQGDL